MRETAIHKSMGLTLYLGMERGKIACHKSEEPYCERDASRAGLLEMRPFGEAKSISGHQTLQLMRRPYGVKGSVYVVTLPAFQRCLEDGPDAAERRPGSGFPTGRGTGDGHLEAHHDLQARPASNLIGEGNPIGSQRIHSTCSLPDFIFIIFESGGKGSLFCNGKKKKGSRFDSAQPNDTSNTHDLCLECVARSLL